MKNLVTRLVFVAIITGLIWILALFTSLWFSGYTLAFGWDQAAVATAGTAPKTCAKVNFGGFPFTERRLDSDHCSLSHNREAAVINKAVFLVSAVLIVINLEGVLNE
jgi:hypothetical protein